MHSGDWLADDLRARLAAERRMEAREAELAAASSEIAEQTRKLTSRIIKKRHEAEAARSEARHLRDVNAQVQTNLDEARSAIRIAERRLWDSLETIKDGFAVFDGGGKLIAANRAFLAPFSDIEIVGLGIPYTALLRLAAEEGIVDCGEAGREGWIEMMTDRAEAPGQAPIVVRFWNDSFVRVVERRTRDGDIVVMALDITGEIAREKELEEARVRAEAANRAKSAFLANMSHEIRTPMNGVLAMADLMAEGELDDEQRLYLDTIRSSGEALLVIINDILDFSRIEAEKLTLNAAPFDLEQSIHDVMVLLQPKAREKQLDMIVDYDMFLPTLFEGDQGRLRQILTNLIGNAVKFTTEGHVLVRVVGLPGAAEGSQRIHVLVEDTGSGIPKEMQEHIFGEFNQAEAGMSRSFDGTGLGLAITRRLVALMGGEMWLESEPGAGASFGFSIVLATDSDAIPEPAQAPRWIERAVVIDPNDASRAVLQKQLSALGLEVGVSADGADLAAMAPTPQHIALVAESVIDALPDGALAPPATVFAVAQGPVPPDGLPMDKDRTILQPFLRATLAEVLASLPPPVAAVPENAPQPAPEPLADPAPAAAPAAAPEAEASAPQAAAPTPEDVPIPAAAEQTEAMPPAMGPDPATAQNQAAVEASMPIPAQAAPEPAPAPVEVIPPAAEALVQSATEAAPNGAPVGPQTAAAEMLAPQDPAAETAAALAAPPAPIPSHPTPQAPSAPVAEPIHAHPSPAPAPAPTGAAETAHAARATPQVSPSPAAEPTGAQPQPTDIPQPAMPAGAEAPAPAAPQPSTAPEAPAATHPPATPIPAPDTGLRVLAAEDNKTNQLVLTKLLKNEDIALTMVENGREALDAYGAGRPDLLLTDISMPVMDGRDATIAIRTHESQAGLPRLPIVAMTAHAGPETEADLRNCGVDYYLTKPLKRDELVQVINAVRLDAAPGAARAAAE